MAERLECPDCARIRRQYAALQQRTLAKQIVETVCRLWPIAFDRMSGPSSRPAECWPRQATMALIAAHCPDITLSAIARMVRRAGHTNTLYALRAHARRREKDMVYDELVRTIERALIPLLAGEHQAFGAAETMEAADGRYSAV